MSKLRLALSCWNYDRMRALADGRVVVIVDDGDELAGEPGGGDLVLAGADGGWINGQVLRANGGMV